MIVIQELPFSVNNESDLSTDHVVDNNEADKFLSLAQELSEEEWEEYDV